MEPTDLSTLSKQILVETLATRNMVLDEIEAELVMIRQELLHRLEEENKDGELIGEYSVTKAKRITFKTTLEQAQILGAVTTSVDKIVLRKLHNKGIKVPGVEITTYLSVRRLDQGEKDGS